MKLKLMAAAIAVLSTSVAANAGELSLQLSTNLGKIGGNAAPAGQEYKKVTPSVGVQYSNTIQDKWVNRYTVGVTETITGKTTPYLQATSEYKIANINGYTIAAGLGTQVQRQYNADNTMYKTKASIMPVASVSKDNISVQMAIQPSSRVGEEKIPGRVMVNLNVGLDGFFGKPKASVAASAVASPVDSQVAQPAVVPDMAGTYEKLPSGTAATGEIYAPLNTTPEDNEVYSPVKEMRNDDEVYRPLSYRSGETAKNRLAMLLK